MKKTEVVAYVRRIPSSPAKKLIEVRGRIIDYILETFSTKQVIERIDIVADALFEVRSQNVEACDGFWLAFIQKLFAEERQLIMLEYCNHVVSDHLYTEFGGWSGPGNVNYTEGRSKLLLIFFAYLGNSVEATIKYCLTLFEVLHESFEKTCNDGKPLIRQSLSGLAKSAYMFMLMSIGLPQRKEIPMSWWFHNVITQAPGNKTAFKIFRFILAIVKDTGGSALIIKNRSDVIDCFDFYDDFESFVAHPYIAASSSEEFGLIRRLIDRITQEQAALKSKGENLLAWYSERREEIATKNKRKFSEVVNNPIRGLRSSGADHIKINISSLRALGIESVVFYPNDCQFPDIKIKLMTIRWTPHLLPISGKLQQFKLDVPDSAICNDDVLSHEILETVIVDAVYRIVVPQKTQKSVCGHKQLKANVCEEQRSHEVRPTFRRLPEGWQASDRAKDLAMEKQGWIVPPGKTFVKGHYRNGVIEYDVSTDPIFVYDDNDLLELIH